MSLSKDAANEDIFHEDSLQTLKKQAISIAIKLKYTLLMLKSDRQQAIAKLKEWDLWGPLIICLIFSLAIGLQANSLYTYDNFVNVFFIFWFGAVLSSVNCRLLGNKISILQSTSIIGYCMLPIALMGLLIAVIPNSSPSVVKIGLILVGLAWSMVSCVIIMASIISETKKYLCAYPILLFYIFLSWYAIVS